jgi:membrane fusion protein, multidrug efflux system
MGIRPLACRPRLLHNNSHLLRWPIRQSKFCCLMNDETVTLRGKPPPKLRKDATWAAVMRGLLSRWSGTSIRMFIVVLAILLIGVVARDWNLWIGSAVLQTTDDANLQADLTPLAAKSPGYVRSVRVQDFQKVKAGDLLVEIVDDDYRAQLDQAQADVETAETAIESIEQQKVMQRALVQQAEAAIEATQADLTRYHLETVRQQNLLVTRYAGTEQRVEQAVDAEKHTQATLALNQAQLAQQRQQLNVLDLKRSKPKPPVRRSRLRAISPK